MADLSSALEELLLGGYDVSSLIRAAGVAPGPVSSSPLGVHPRELQAPVGLQPVQLPQSSLAGWPGSAAADATSALYEEVAQSLVAKLEEQRMQQVQVATALQQLQVLQQQQELANLQQQLNALHSAPRAGPFQRSRTTDLESLGRGPALELNNVYACGVEFDQQRQLAAMQHAAMTGAPMGLQRVPGVIGHSTPVRSFSSEHLLTGQRRQSTQLLPQNGQPLPVGNTRRPPLRQPSGLGPHPRGQSRPADGGRRARYAATAKAPSWASEDWHPMKAVLANGAQASSGTGVFLPHLADKQAASGAGPTAAATSSPGGDRRSMLGEDARPTAASVQLSKAAAMSQPLMAGQHASLSLVPGQAGHPVSPPHDGSPACSVDSNSFTSDRLSCRTTHDFSRGSTFTEAVDPHPGGPCASYITDPAMRAVAEEPEREKEDLGEECDFASLARELADLMNRQALAE